MKKSNNFVLTIFVALSVPIGSCSHSNQCEEYAARFRGRKYLNVEDCLRRVAEVAVIVDTTIIHPNPLFASELDLTTDDSVRITIFHSPIHSKGKHKSMMDTVLKAHPNGFIIEWPSRINTCIDTVWLISQPGRPVEE